MENEIGEVLYRKGKDDGNNDIWDDSALIKAYDEAVNLMQEKLVERGIDSTSVSNNRVKRKKKKKPKTAPKKGPTKSSAGVSQTSQWAVGDHCRAVYTEDGDIYEAVILSIDGDNATCYIRYLGYGNEEEQLLTDLLPSEAVANDSKEAAYAEDRVRRGRDSETFTESESGVDWEYSHNRTRSHPRSRAHGHGTPRRLSQGSDQSVGFMPSRAPFGGMPPPFSLPPFMAGPNVPFMPPPMMPMPRSGFNAPDFPGPQPCPRMPPPPPLDDLELIDSDKEALHSMLISWYMSGYHTGYYQGLKAGRMSKAKEKQKNESRI